MTEQMPGKCPLCGCDDIGEKYEGEADTVECYHCEGFWYLNRGKLETVSRSDREAANGYLEAATDRRIFGVG